MLILLGTDVLKSRKMVLWDDFDNVYLSIMQKAGYGVPAGAAAEEESVLHGYLPDELS